MGHYPLGKKKTVSNLKESVRANKPLQFIVIIAFFILQLIYIVALVWQSSAIFAIVQHNTDMFSDDTSLSAVASYEVAETGKVSIALKDGRILENMDTDFSFVNNKGENETYYDADENLLITELANTYAKEFLNGSKYWVVLVSSILVTTFLILARKRGWAVFSKRYIRVMSIVLGVLVIFSGIFVVLIF